MSRGADQSVVISDSHQDDAPEHLSRRRLLAGAGAAGTAGVLASLVTHGASTPAFAAGVEGVFVNVKDYGAKGDGKTDDSAAIQAAINATAPDGRAVFMPSGVYMIGAPLSMRNGLTLRGAGRAATTLRLMPSSNGPILNAPVVGSAYQSVDDLMLSDLTLDGDAGSTEIPSSMGSSALLHAYQSHRWHIARCRFMRGRGYGIGLQGGPTNPLADRQGPHEDTYIVDSELISNGMVTTAASDGIDTKSARRFTMVGCYARDNVGVGINIRAHFATLVDCRSDGNALGFTLTSSTNEPESNENDAYFTVLGGSAEFNKGSGLAVSRTSPQSIDDGLTYATIVGFNARENVGGGLAVPGPTPPNVDNAVALSIVGGQYIHNSQNGISIQRTRSLSIDGAICRENEKNGLRILDCVEGSVTGCQFRGNGHRAIYLGGVTVTTNFIATVGNVMKGNAVGTIESSGTNSTVVGNAVDESPSVSAASTLVLPPCHNLITVTGTTTIATIKASYDGRLVVLTFADTVTVIKGSNLKLANNFTATPSDTLTLICQGGAWSEVARSAN